MTKEERYKGVMAYFEKAMPDAQTELHFGNAWQLLVAVILSAQCTDKRVNETTPALFAHFPTAKEMAEATVDEVYQLIKSISYPHNKSEHLVGMSKRLVADFGGIVPQTMEELTTLPGVGRKTANVMLAVAFGKPAMPVDTHVLRVSWRLGFTPQGATPLETEMELTKHIPKKKQGLAHHWLILHGRYVCKAQKPLCGECGVKEFCKLYTTEQQPKHQ